jgi:hypothetical protein
MKWEYHEHPKFSFFKDITGEVFGELTVLGYAGVKRHPSKKTSSLWVCRCACGKEIIAHGVNLKKGTAKTCGCSRGSHHMSDTPEYIAWEAINQRCNNQENPNYKNYGARGISMCERWRSFEAFIEDVGPRPSSKHSIDREDNSGGYTPENCRWATGKIQHRNKRSNRIITIGGVSRCLVEWCEITGVSANGFIKRVKKGWADKDLLSPPISRADRLKMTKV